METISGGPSEQFLPDTILQAAKLNKALENWVVTEVPGEDEGEIGDVVFVTGPGDGGSPDGGGKVLQVVQTEYNTVKEVASTTFTDAGGSVTITPTDATSKVLVTMDLSLHLSCTTNDDVYGYVAMYRNGVSIKDFSNVNRIRAALGLAGYAMVTTRTTVSFLDSPNTTSPCTYTARIKVNNTANARKVTAQTLNSPSTYTAWEIAQ